MYNNKPEYVHLLDIYDFKKPLPEIEALLNKIKAKAFLTDPILENFKGIELDIVKKIAEKMDNLSKTLKDELDLWDLAMVNFIAEKPGYKDAIIAYSKNYPYLKDNNSKPLTEDTFNHIVVSVLVGKANNKETLDEIKQNFSTVIAKNEILKKAIKEKEKNYK